jgi:hypothetical protein
MDEHINKTWYVYTMEYDSTFKRKKMLAHGIAQLNLSRIMLNEKISDKRPKSHDSTSVVNFRDGKEDGGCPG